MMMHMLMVVGNDLYNLLPIALFAIFAGTAIVYAMDYDSEEDDE